MKYYQATIHVTFCLAVLDVSGNVITSSALADEKSSVYHTLHVQDILLDNQASVSIFGSREMLHNIRSAPHPVVITGVSDAPEARFTATQIGAFKSFENVYFSPNSTANMLSFQEIQKYRSISCQILSDVLLLMVSSTILS